MMKNYTPIKVIIADDHEIFRDGFRVLLKKQTEVELVGEASNGEELIRLAKDLNPDVIITDIKMPVLDGIGATKILCEELPHIGIIAFTMFDEDNFIIEILEAGAKGYLLKNAHKTEIVDAIKAVSKGGTYYCNHTSNRLAEMISKSSFNPYRKIKKPEFTEREKEVICLMCQAYSTKEIAARLDLGARTVETHRQNIFEKIGAPNMVGVVVYAIKNGIYKM